MTRGSTTRATVPDELAPPGPVLRPLPDLVPAATPRHRAVLEAFAAVTAQVSTVGDPHELLVLVGRSLCELLGAARCSPFLRRADGRFQGVGAHAAGGAEDELTRAVLARRAPVLAADVRGDQHRPWAGRVVLAVPLVFDDEVIGMIHVHDEGSGRTCSDDDVEVAALFGGLAALAVRQAQLSTRMAGQVRQLARQKDAIAQRGDLRARLTRAVLEGADVDGVVRLLSELAGKPVVLVDPEIRVRAWAAPAVLRLAGPPDLPAHVREAPAVRATIAALDVDRPSATIPPQLAAGLSRRHLLCVLVIEGRRAGYLDIVEMGGLLGPLDTELAEHGATVLSLQLLSEQRLVQAEGRARDDFLADLLHGSRDPGALAGRAPRFGIGVGRPHVLVRFPGLDDAPVLPGVERRRLVVDAAARRLGCGTPHAPALPDAVVLLLRLPDEPGPAVLRRLHRGLEHVLAEVGERAGIRSGVVSGVCRSVADFAAAHRETREVAELLAAHGGRDGVVPVDGFAALRLAVAGNGIEDAVRFAQQRLGPLRGAGDLEATVRAYLASGAQVRATAEALGVHENTVRYRLGRVQRATGLDVRSFDALLAVRLAFQVLDLVERSAGEG